MTLSDNIFIYKFGAYYFICIMSVFSVLCGVTRDSHYQCLPVVVMDYLW